jgi:hypothetical protein
MKITTTTSLVIKQEYLDTVDPILEKYMEPEMLELLNTAIEQLKEFKKVKTNTKYKLELGKMKGYYIHILRDGKEIGCFAYKKKNSPKGLVFIYHNSHKNGKKGQPPSTKQIEIKKLNQQVIKDIIENT